MSCGHFLHHHRKSRGISQFRVLGLLERHQPLTQRQLQDMMELRQGSLSELLKKLEDQGYLIRTPGPEDHRQRTIRITPEGAAFHQAHLAVRRRECEELLSPLSPREQEQFRDFLARLLESWRERQEERV